MSRRLGATTRGALHQERWAVIFAQFAAQIGLLLVRPLAETQALAGRLSATLSKRRSLPIATGGGCSSTWNQALNAGLLPPNPRAGER